MTLPEPPRTVLLLSGLLCDDTAWEDVAAILAPRLDVRMISFAGFDSIGAMAEHALASAPPGFAVAGHSMGGRVALEMLRRAPGRVERIALLNTGVGPTAAHEAASRGRLVDLAESQGMDALADVWLPPMMSRAGLADAGLMARLRAMIGRGTPQSFAGQIRALLDRPDARPVLDLIDVPTLLLSGTEDGWSPVAQHAAMQCRVAHAALVAVDGGGHMVPAEQPRAVAQALGAWLDDDPRSARVPVLSAAPD